MVTQSTSRCSSRWKIVALSAGAWLGACASSGRIVTDHPYRPLPDGMTAQTEKDGRMRFKVPAGWKADDPRIVIPGVQDATAWIVFAFTRSSDAMAFRKGDKGAFALWCDNQTGNSIWVDRLDKLVKREAPLSVEVEAFRIETKAKADMSFLFRWSAEVVREGARVPAPFMLYTGRKDHAFLDVNGCEYMFYGRANSLEARAEVEEDFIAILRSIEAP